MTPNSVKTRLLHALDLKDVVKLDSIDRFVVVNYHQISPALLWVRKREARR